MRNPLTSIPGILLLLGALLTFAGHAIRGDLTAKDLSELPVAMAGAGLIAAKDGGP
ncbi:MAG: hypothetical protein WA005_02050 [Candidatus Binataceae bacterium]